MFRLHLYSERLVSYSCDYGSYLRAVYGGVRIEIAVRISCYYARAAEPVNSSSYCARLIYVTELIALSLIAALIISAN